MNTVIKSDYLNVAISSFGAELQSICCEEKEFLWQGNKEIWGNRSPLLFPIVGRLKDDKLKFDGNTYTLKKHGFAQDMEFELVEKSDTSVELALYSSDFTLKHYPFAFKLSVIYSVNDNKLNVTYNVKNIDKKTIYFSIGGHPGFNCKMGDKLVFNKKETAYRLIMNKDSYINEKQLFLNNSSEIIITDELFEKDALIFNKLNSDSVTLNTTDWDITVNYHDAPYLGIWAKPGAPYVCVEPWFGVDDSIDADCSFDKKEGIIQLGIKQEFVYSYEIIIDKKSDK